MSLRRIIEIAARDQNCSLKDLSVLSASKDPYRLDTPAYHCFGAWIGERVEEFYTADRRFHWRGLHYRLVIVGGVVKPNGQIYRNIDSDWIWLSEKAGKAARWLGYVGFDRVKDQRNNEVIINRRPSEIPRPFVHKGLVDVDLPALNWIAPTAEITGFAGRQRYALTIFGEKASLDHVVTPIASRFGADLILGTGETSDTRIWEIARDAAADGREMIVFTLTDCDPAGYQMTISIARKLQALRDLHFPTLRFQVVPASLTVEQVKRLGLPSTPLKETELRADRWREAFGVQQTEIDALAEAAPDELRKIIIEAISPYFDATLDRRVAVARAGWQEAAQQIVDEHADADALDSIRDRAEATFERFSAEVEAINDDLAAVAEGIPELPPPEVPEPEITEEQERRQSPLISTSMEWAEATRILIARKQYVDGDE